MQTGDTGPPPLGPRGDPPDRSGAAAAGRHLQEHPGLASAVGTAAGVAS